MNDNEKKNLPGDSGKDAETDTELDLDAFLEAPEEKKTAEKAGDIKPEKKKTNKRTFGDYLKSSRFKHGAVSKGITVGFLVLIILLNVVVSVLSERFPSINLDLTASKTNTLSEGAKTAVDEVKAPTSIYILVDEETAKLNSDYQQVSALTAKMVERNKNISVEYVDLDKNPKFVTDYPNENIVRGSVIVKTEKRYKVVAYSDLFSTTYDQSYNQIVTSNVDSALASAIGNVNVSSVPVVAVDIGHLGGSSNQYSSVMKQYAAEYETILKSNNFDVKEINLLSDEIPEGTQLLVLPAPITDYIDSEIEKIDSYLNNTKLEKDRTLMMGGYPIQADTPKLDAYLKEWGMQPGEKLVLGTDKNTYFSAQGFYSGSCLLAQVQQGVNIGKGDYAPLAMLESIPVTILPDVRDGVTVTSLIKSPEGCVLFDTATEETSEEKSVYDLAALATQKVTVGDKTYNANVAVMGSMLSMSNLGSSFANATYVTDLTRYLTGVTDAGAVVTGTSAQTITKDITATAGTIQILSLLFTILLPLAIVVLGIVVFVRRRHL